MTDTINLADKLTQIDELWSPRIVAALNGQHVKLARLHGTFVWHAHEDADELFLVLQGRLVIQLRDRDVVLEAGELFVVPRGVEHRPVAENEVHVLLFEPEGTRNTGEVDEDRTVDAPDWI